MARPPAVLADGLWQCLCPAYTRRPGPLLQRAVAARRLPRRNHATATAAPTWGQSRAPATRPRESPPTPAPSAPKPAPYDFTGDPRVVAGLLTQLDAAAAQADKPRTQQLVLRLVRDHGQPPDAVHYAALLAAEADPAHGSAAGVETLLQDLTADGVTPDSSVWHAALKALAVHPHYLLRNQVLAELERRWIDVDAHGQHYVGAALFRERQLERGLAHLAAMQAAGHPPAPWLQQLALAHCLAAEAFPAALALLRDRAGAGSAGTPVPAAVWAAALDRGAAALCHPLVDHVWRRAVDSGALSPSSGACVAVLDTAARHANFGLATDVFRVLGQRASPLQPHHYEALLDAYLAAGDLPAALVVLGRLLPAAHPPAAAHAARFALLHWLRADPAARVPRCLALLVDPAALGLATGRPPPPAATAAANRVWSPDPIRTACLEALVYAHALDAAQAVVRHWHAYGGSDSAARETAAAAGAGAAAPLQALVQAAKAAGLPAAGRRVLTTALAPEFEQAGVNELRLRLLLGRTAEATDAATLVMALQTWDELRAAGTAVALRTVGVMLEKLERAGAGAAAAEIAVEMGVQRQVSGAGSESPGGGESIEMYKDEAGQRHWRLTEGARGDA